MLDSAIRIRIAAMAADQAYISEVAGLMPCVAEIVVVALAIPVQLPKCQRVDWLVLAALPLNCFGNRS